MQDILYQSNLRISNFVNSEIFTLSRFAYDIEITNMIEINFPYSYLELHTLLV